MLVHGYRVDNLSYAVIDDYFSQEELKEVYAEVLDLRRLAQSTSLTSEGSHFEKTSGGFFLDNVFVERFRSPTLMATRKLFDPLITDQLRKIDVIFDEIPASNVDTLLVNYYVPGECYGDHRDDSRLTAVILLGVGEFSGGGFYFPEQDERIEFKENRLIIFPSCVRHASIPIMGDLNSLRISLAHFINRIS